MIHLFLIAKGRRKGSARVWSVHRKYDFWFDFDLNIKKGRLKNNLEFHPAARFGGAARSS